MTTSENEPIICTKKILNLFNKEVYGITEQEFFEGLHIQAFTEINHPFIDGTTIIEHQNVSEHLTEKEKQEVLGLIKKMK